VSGGPEPAVAPWLCHCEELFMRRGRFEVIDKIKTEIASYRSQRRLKFFFRSLFQSRIKGNFYIVRKHLSFPQNTSKKPIPFIYSLKIDRLLNL
jgi:hypothetical protein